MCLRPLGYLCPNEGQDQSPRQGPVRHRPLEAVLRVAPAPSRRQLSTGSGDGRFLPRCDKSAQGRPTTSHWAPLCQRLPSTGPPPNPLLRFAPEALGSPPPPAAGGAADVSSPCELPATGPGARSSGCSGWPWLPPPPGTWLLCAAPSARSANATSGPTCRVWNVTWLNTWLASIWPRPWW